MTVSDPFIEPIRAASRTLVREFGFMSTTLAGTDLPPSAVHALVETGLRGTVTSAVLCDLLNLDKSSVSRLVSKLVARGDLSMHRSADDTREKPLSLTLQGRETVAAIDAHAARQVSDALATLPPTSRATVRDGLTAYAGALQSSRTGRPVETVPIEIATGYRPGAIGRIAEMHAVYYARTSGFGCFFEGKVASEAAEFAARLDRPGNGLWLAMQGETVVGSIAIDGEDMGPGIAHLRWFIVDDGLRGSGAGRRMLTAAIDFCDGQGFAETQLWTFRGLDAARKLYEAAGFTLVEESPGRQWGTDVVEQRFARLRRSA